MGRLSNAERERYNRHVRVTPAQIGFDSVAMGAIDSEGVRFFPHSASVVVRGDQSSPLRIDDGSFVAADHVMGNQVCQSILAIVGKYPLSHKTGEHEITLYREEL